MRRPGQSRAVRELKEAIAGAEASSTTTGRLTDDTARELIGELLERLAEAVREREAIAGQLA